MKALQVGMLSRIPQSVRNAPVRGGPDQLEPPVQSHNRSAPAGREFHSADPFPGPGNLVISYQINSVNGAIRAEIIDPESGKVVREIEVRPDISSVFQKGSFLESSI